MIRTALQKFDRLFDRLTIEELQNQIEDMGFVLADRQELVDALRDINQNLVTRNQDLQTTKDSLQQDRDAAVARCTSLESDVRRLKERVEAAVQRENNLIELRAEYNKYVEESKGVVSRYAIAAQTERGNAEHLAKQAIRLQQENKKIIDDNAKAKCLVKENQILRGILKNTLIGLGDIFHVSGFFGLRKARLLADDILTKAHADLDANNIQV